MNIVPILPRQVVPVPVPDELSISNSFNIESVTRIDAIVAVVALVAGFVLSRLVKHGLNRYFRRLEGMPDDAGRLIAQICAIVVLLIGLMVALESLGFSWGLLGGLLILTLVVAAFTAKPLLEDLGAGLILQVRRPFTLGDTVRLNDEDGVAAEIDSRTVVLRTIDGRRVHLPSRSVLNSTITNLSTEGRRLSEFVAGVAYDTDLDHAQKIAVDAMSMAPGVLEDPPAEALVGDFADSTIDLACRFWHAPDVPVELRARDEAMRAVKRAFDANGIEIAFPQRVLWHADDSG
ncbi:MAG: mechanosensitive ion channel family protein [Acidimicrobiia bacterium]|nr:mechanosensitive ion channel family protein [Acidimicrobiia bacterium]